MIVKITVPLLEKTIYQAVIEGDVISVKDSKDDVIFTVSILTDMQAVRELKSK